MNKIIKKNYENYSGYLNYNSNNPDFVNTYGEITHNGFKKGLKGIYTKNKIFYDLGSGIGKLVMYSGLEKNFKKSIGVELNHIRHNMAKDVLKNIKKQLKGGDKKKAYNIEFVNDSLFNKNYFNGDVYFISNLCFTDKMNKKLAHYFKKYNTNKGTIVLCSNKLPMRKNVRSVSKVDCPMTWDKNSSIYKYILN